MMPGVEAADPILPRSIVHRYDEVWDGDRLMNVYNYFDYEFEIGAYLYKARAYLDDMSTVSIVGPVQAERELSDESFNSEIDQRVLAYLRRRFRYIERLTPTGYVPIE